MLTHSGTRRALKRLTEVGPGLTFVEGPQSNWIVVEGPGAVELIDCGYPGDRALLKQSIARVGGRVADLKRIIITHGHSDHLGSSSVFSKTVGAVVATGPEELANVRREVTEQVGFSDLLPVLYRPRTLMWLIRVIGAGGLSDVGVARAVPLEGSRVSLSTGHMLELIPSPGHTTGHVSFFEPASAALITGDALVTGHPLLSADGLQMLPDFFHHDVPTAESSGQALSELAAQWILPGHGPAWRSPSTREK